MRRLPEFLVCIAFFSPLSQQLPAAMIANGSFELDSNFDNIPDGWSFSATGVGRSMGSSAMEGDYFLVFSSGNQPHTGVIEQTLITDIGSIYEVSFGVLQRGGASLVQEMRLFASALDVDDGSVLGSATAVDTRKNPDVPNPDITPYLIFTFQFTATDTQTLLQFKDDITIPAADNSDILLDRVQAQQLSAVPEPSSIALFGLGGLCLTLFAVRRNKRGSS